MIDRYAQLAISQSRLETVELEVATLREELHDMEVLFDLQRERMAVAQEMWWDDGNDRDIYPDLGVLLKFLCDRIDSQKAELEDLYEEQSHTAFERDLNDY